MFTTPPIRNSIFETINNRFLDIYAIIHTNINVRRFLAFIYIILFIISAIGYRLLFSPPVHAMWIVEETVDSATAPAATTTPIDPNTAVKWYKEGGTIMVVATAVTAAAVLGYAMYKSGALDPVINFVSSFFSSPNSSPNSSTDTNSSEIESKVESKEESIDASVTEVVTTPVIEEYDPLQLFLAELKSDLYMVTGNYKSGSSTNACPFGNIKELEVLDRAYAPLLFDGVDRPGFVDSQQSRFITINWRTLLFYEQPGSKSFHESLSNYEMSLRNRVETRAEWDSANGSKAKI